jgi:hypothetical protein
VATCHILRGAKALYNIGQRVKPVQHLAGRSNRIAITAPKIIEKNALKLNDGIVRSDFIVGERGVTIPISAARLEKGFREAGFYMETLISDGLEMGVRIYLKNYNIRIMKASGPAPLRASFQNVHGSRVNPFTGRVVHFNKAIYKNKIKFIEDTHLTLYD